MNGSPQVGGYSFYLNVVVINTNVSDSVARTTSDCSVSLSVSQDEATNAANNAKDEEPPIPPPAQPVAEESDEQSSEEELKKSSNGGPADGEIVAVGGVRDDPKVKLLVQNKALIDFAFGRVRSPKGRNDSGKNSKDGRGFMSSIGNSISKSSSNISKRASRFMASKTMVSRAEKAVVECIPLVTEEIGVEMSISKRFQQGPVFVLEVDMKGCEILDLLKKVDGEEAAKHYACVKEGLEFLDLPDAQEAFLKEILPKLRKSMMEKMSEIVPEKMKLKKAYADLEIQCVALEDAEEAKWLYNFLAFMEEMK